MTLMVITGLQQKDLGSPRKVVVLLVGSASEQWAKPGIGTGHSDSGIQGRIYFLLVTISMLLSKVQGDPLLKVKLSIAVGASLYPCTVFLVARRAWDLRPGDQLLPFPAHSSWPRVSWAPPGLSC